MSLCLSVLSQSGPPKSVGGGGGVVYHTSTGQYIGVVTFFFFFFFVSGSQNWTKNRLDMVSKVRNFWLCVFSGVVATTLILIKSSILIRTFLYQSQRLFFITATMPSPDQYRSILINIDQY